MLSLLTILQPILKQVTDVLSEGSQAVIDSDDQYEVFTNPNASDPSHSLLSKVSQALLSFSHVWLTYSRTTSL